MAYATVDDVQSRMSSEMSETQRAICEKLIDDAGIIVDAYNADASADNKQVVVCRMVIRAIGSSDAMSMPIGANQGSMSALGYSQSWTMSSGSVGELYLAKIDKKLLGVGAKIGSYSPVEAIGGCCND